MKKQLLALSIAITMLTGIIVPVISVQAGHSTGKPAITVVGKRITNDDNYFEISLEINGDPEDYTAIGAVLQYDPTLLVPTTWDDEAVPVDMSESKDWASRRALPTLGKDTWTTHTALTYIDEITDDSGTKEVGYLYLGAEYPGVLPKATDTPATTDQPATTNQPVVTPTPASTPTATENPDKYTNPIVVARFMYANATAKATIGTKWTEAWDKDWNLNEILTIAPDDVAELSPAQYGFVIYDSDFSMKGFQRDYTGSVLIEDPIKNIHEQANKDEIEIVLGEGDSAKSGGLSLNDVSVVLFYDWDNSLLGSFTLGRGVDSSEDINNYVKKNFIHPDLQGNTNYSSNARVDNYRGEYPSIAPGNGATFDNGGDYPLTNKLEYCFAGRDINAGLPFVGGWTAVTPETMEDKWTALDGTTTYGKMPELDGNGDPVNAGDTIPDMASFDFTNITDSVMYAKAVYTPGEWLDNGSGFYSPSDSVNYEIIGTIASATAGTYSIQFQYKRVNTSGYGVTRIKEPKVKMDITQDGATQSSAMSVDVKNGEVFDVMLTPSKTVNKIGYTLNDVYGLNIMTGLQRSRINDFGVFENKTKDMKGFIYLSSVNTIIAAGYDNYKNGNTAGWTAITRFLVSDANIKSTAAAGEYNAINFNAGKAKLLNCIQTATIENGGDYPTNLTYYQLQYFAITNAYLPAADAEAYCKTNYTWCQ